MSTAARRQLSATREPLYSTIAGLLRNEIYTGQWPNGARVPTLEQLVAQFGVARATVRQAISVLTDEGLLSVQQGVGTFVKSPDVAPQRVRIESDWDQLLTMLEGNRPQLLSTIDSVSEIPSLPGEGVSSGDYHFMHRIHTQNGQPYGVLKIYIDQETYKTKPELFDSDMIIPHLHSVPGLKIKTMRQTFEIGSADLKLSEQLGVSPNAPVGIMRRVIADTDDRIIYLGVGHYRGDLVVFETRMQIPTRQ